MKQNKILQSGRSMVEMLGVLAIIGVLSIGSIAGYSYAIDKYRANTIVDDVMLRAIEATAQFDATGDANLSEWPTMTAGEHLIGLEDKTIGIQVDGLPKRVCQMVFDGMINNTTIKIGTTEYSEPSDDVCSDNNTMVFYINPPEKEEVCVQEHPLAGNNCYPCDYEGVITVNGANECLKCPNRTIQTPVIRFYQCILK